MIETLSDHLVFFGSGMSLVLALSQGLNRPLNARKLFLLVFFFSLSVMQFQIYLLLGPLGKGIVLGAQPVGFPKFLVGPALYLYFQQILKSKSSFSRRQLLHFLPAIISIVMRLIVWAGRECGVAMDSCPEHFFLVTVPLAYDFVGLFSIFAYIFVIFKKGGVFNIRGERSAQIETAFWLILASAFIITVMIIYGLLSGDALFFRISSSLVSLHIISWFIIGMRYPEFLNLVRREIKKHQYERSLLRKYDQNILKERLLDLMETEKVYYEPELTLKTLAGKLLITPHQLSELLNSTMKMNFNTFINTYRVAESKRLIEMKPDSSILAVAFTVGFNTQSVFYSAFLKHAGVSPVKYRDISLKKIKFTGART